MIHFTHTGVLAGKPFCTIDRLIGENLGEKFMHPGYGILTTENIRKGRVTIEGVDMDICPACAEMWLED